MRPLYRAYRALNDTASEVPRLSDQGRSDQGVFWFPSEPQDAPVRLTDLPSPSLMSLPP